MNWQIQNSSYDDVIEIVGWKYDPPYDLYNNEMNEDVIAEMLDGSYLTVKDESERLIGFFCTGKAAQVPAGAKYGVYDKKQVDIGIGMKPSLTGKGMGPAFLSKVLEHVTGNNPGIPTRLTVAEFNQRAIRLYEKAGFVKEHLFSRGEMVFLTMVKEKNHGADSHSAP